MYIITPDRRILEMKNIIYVKRSINVHMRKALYVCVAGFIGLVI